MLLRWGCTLLAIERSYRSEQPGACVRACERELFIYACTLSGRTCRAGNVQAVGVVQAVE